jgi:hypothetical protein
LFTEKDALKIIKQYMSSPEGKKHLEEEYNSQFKRTKISATPAGYFLDMSEMVRIASRLKEMIMIALNDSVVTFPEDLELFERYIRVIGPEPRADGTYVVRIVFDDKALERPSLVTTDGKPLGKGVNDIIGLFTVGYSTNYVYGEWTTYTGLDTDRGDGRIRSRAHRPPNSFMSDAISAFEREFAEYNFLVLYPALWGGTT